MVTDRVFHVVMEHTGASIGILTYRNSEQDPFKVIRVNGLASSVLAPGTSLNGGMCGWGPGSITTTGKPQLIHSGLREAMANIGIDIDRGQNMICIPVSAPNEVCGLLQLVSGRGQAFREQHLKDLGGVGFYIYAAIGNARMITTIKQQRDAAEAMYEIGLDISRSLELDEILKRAVHQSLMLMGSVYSWYLEYRPDEKPYARIRKIAGKAPASFREGGQVKLVDRVLALLSPDATDHTALVIDDLLEIPAQAAQQDDAVNEPFCEPEVLTILRKARIRSAIMVRVGGPGKARGLLCSFSDEKGFFKSQHVDMFKRLANQVLIALTNADLHSRLSGMAVIEERQRLSDELHDNMSQMINGLALEFHAIAKLANQPGKVDMTMQRINHIQDLLQDAKARIRQSIFELRLPEDSDIWQNLRMFTERFQHWHDLDIHTSLPTGSLSLPLDCQREVIRVVQEALWNARRHSGSAESALAVTLDDLNGTIKIAITDHGDGAERSQLQQGQGLATMQARAERLDGKLSIHNDRGSGFRVELEFPAYARN